MKLLLIIHAFITLAAGIVLIVMPEKIPETVNITIDKSQYLICYFLGAAEIAIAYLSFAARKFTERSVLKMISFTFIVFHLSTATVEIFAFTQGLSGFIWANVALRIIISMLFWYFGVHKTQLKA